MPEDFSTRSNSLTIEALDETVSIQFPNEALIRNVLESQSRFFRFRGSQDLIDYRLDSVARGVWGRRGFISVISVRLFQHRGLILA